VNNQILETKINRPEVRNVIITISSVILLTTVIILSFWLLPSKNPYIIEVLSYQGNGERGEAIFNVNCAGCHGIQGVGNVGPTLTNVSKRKSEQSIINQVISGKTPPMPKFQPSAEEMADLLAYLRELN